MAAVNKYKFRRKSTYEADEVLENVFNHDLVFIGIDPSLTGTSICVIHNQKVYNKVVFVAYDDEIDRLIKIREAVIEIIRREAFGKVVGLIAIEGYAMAAKGRVFNLGELGGVLRVAIKDMGYDLIEVPPTTLKKFFSGNGAAKKADMISVAEGYGATIYDDNMADSFALAVAAHNYLTTQFHFANAHRSHLHKSCRQIIGHHPNAMSPKEYAAWRALQKTLKEKK